MPEWQVGRQRRYPLSFFAKGVSAPVLRFCLEARVQVPPFDGRRVRLDAGFPVPLKNPRQFSEALFDKGSTSGAPPPHSRSVGPGQLLMSLPRLLLGRLAVRSQSGRPLYVA